MKGKVKNMTEIRNILHRLRQGQPKRSIHRELGVHRCIIRQVHNLAIAKQWLDPNCPMPSDAEINEIWNYKLQPKQKIHPLDPHKAQIEQWHKEKKSSVVIYQLLKEVCICSPQSIGRYRQKHFPKAVEPVMVRLTVPGEAMEVDFGELGTFLEIVLNQEASTFFMGVVRALEHFNGVPAHVVIDNLKAGVIRSTMDNDMINRSFQQLAEHYGFIISPCNPYSPHHKGGVENDVKYVKRNFLCGSSRF